MTYVEKLKDPRWQKKRLEILESSEWTCEVCGNNTKELHVHHKYYEKNKSPWEYDSKDLVVFCKECHSSWHKAKKQLDQVLGQVLYAEELIRICGYALAVQDNLWPADIENTDKIIGFSDRLRTSPKIIQILIRRHGIKDGPVDIPSVLFQQNLDVDALR